MNMKRLQSRKKTTQKTKKNQKDVLPENTSADEIRLKRKNVVVFDFKKIK